MKNYKDELSLEDAAALAIAAINLKSEQKGEGIKHIKMSQIRKDTKLLEKIPEDELTKYAKIAKEKFK